MLDKKSVLLDFGFYALRGMMIPLCSVVYLVFELIKIIGLRTELSRSAISMLIDLLSRAPSKGSKSSELTRINIK